jgi:hypothetical protein
LIDPAPPEITTASPLLHHSSGHGLLPRYSETFFMRIPPSDYREEHRKREKSSSRPSNQSRSPKCRIYCLFCALFQTRSFETPRCLERAAECERRAEQATDELSRNGYRRLAENWRLLAETHRQIASMDKTQKSGR